MTAAWVLTLGSVVFRIITAAAAVCPPVHGTKESNNALLL